MEAGGEAAEQMVKMSLQGVEVIGKLSMDGGERLLKLIVKALSDIERTKGKASLLTMLKSKEPIKVFEIKDKDLKKFCQEAKKYGVMYHVLKDKKGKSGKSDILVRGTDAAKINRIFQRFNLGISNESLIRASLKEHKSGEKSQPQREHPEKSAEDKFIDELFAKPIQKEKSHTSNPSVAKTEKSHPSEPSSKSKKYSSSRDNPSVRHSVKKQIEEIKKASGNKEKGQTQQKKSQQHIQPKKKAQGKGVKKNGRSR